tara:strand:+ start:744 stop:1373 length:630 start_codon:yes stop_codon:yes gene_type:complete
MNGSKKYNFLWWSYGSNATRSTGRFFQTIFVDFCNYVDNTYRSTITHAMGIPADFNSNSLVACNVRNPYTLAVSHFNDLKDEDDDLVFSDWLMSSTELDIYQDPVRWETAGKVPDIFIHMETLEKDLINFPCVKQWLSEYDGRVDILEHTLNECIRKNGHLGESKNDKYKNGFQDIEGLYTQELADKVVELATEDYFKQIGYSIDSWKS